jgi:anti-anti-sigma factor
VEITKLQSGEILEVSVRGRLDAYWADHLTRALEEAVRDGADHIRLNMAEVAYMSSVGIRVLLKFHKQLQRISGSFAVSNPSEAVKTVLELAGLQTLLAVEAPPQPTAVAQPHTQLLDHNAASFELFPVEAGGAVRARLIGNPELLSGSRFGSPHCRAVRFPAATFGIGLGAFGGGFSDCQARFGEFLVAAGSAAYLPTDGTNVPDYLVSTGALVPELHVLYALVCDGNFTALARFEAKAGAGSVTLSDIVSGCLAAANADAIGIVMVAESAGLMGAALRRSPAVEASETAPFTHPEIRNWLSFTPERAHARSLALVVGAAARAEAGELGSLLRPLGSDIWPAGHFHAAAFSYRRLQKGRLDLTPTVTTLFEAETVQGILHLLNDDRPIVGMGQSEFVRGACWVAPIKEIVVEPSVVNG